jgi:hypothetical protein
MPTELERPITSVMAKARALVCVPNTRLEDLHAGPGAISYTDDFSDVRVTAATGRRIPWPEVCRISDD